MIVLGVDRTSQSYAFGQVAGTALLAAVGIALLWFLTRRWRKGPHAEGPDELAAAERVRAQRRRVAVLATVAILVLAVTRAVFQYSSVEEDTPAAGSTVRYAVEPPRTVRGYTVTGDEDGVLFAADEGGDVFDDEGTGYGRYWLLKHDGIPAGVLRASVKYDWSPELTEERRWDPPEQSLRNWFDQEDARDIHWFDPGPLGGALVCGHLDVGKGGVVSTCGWLDAYTDGYLGLADVLDLDTVADITRDLRAATEKPL
ncbi:hypothetical protein SRB5_43840 [Streptomyces sp. RB5]|uniref:Uncharacterized protein n=1 Tax=Streptomyces smaragdinus TaxID=2585196 RepID=A0A7K0CMF7_9ACTN|nr:hypothetical protein [Streptomyces smaragdinus]MQY14222.1 hypothetical protein [Streptomyces smaragdinus]